MFAYPGTVRAILKDLKYENAGIVVEGKRDYYALLNSGIDGNRIFESARSSNSNLEKKLSDGFDKVIPLFDSDRTGRNRLRLFSAYFAGTSVKIDLSYDSRLIMAGITHIEDIDNVLCTA